MKTFLTTASCILGIILLTYIGIKIDALDQKYCEVIYGKVISSHFIQPSYRENWTATTGRVQLEDGTITTFYSRPNNIYEVGDIIKSTNNCGDINQEIGRDHS